MDTLETLGVALGLAALAGLNLYLTVFVTGLAVHLGWVRLPEALHELSVLGDPWIIGVSGVLYFIGFFADKIPWVDTASDAIHTFIRPIGAALIAVLALGEAHPTVQVVAALLAGGAALTAHTAKAGARLVANASPEPFSNVGLSLGEDALVVAGLGLMAWQPIVAFCLILALLILIWVILPRLLRAMRAILWLAWRKLNDPPAGSPAEHILQKLPESCELALRRAHATAAEPSLSVHCMSGGGPRLPRNLFGWLVQFDNGELFFVSQSWFGSVVLQIPASEDLVIERQSRFLSEKLIVSARKASSSIFVFDRGGRELADHVADRLRQSGKPEPLTLAAQE